MQKLSNPSDPCHRDKFSPNSACYLGKIGDGVCSVLSIVMIGILVGCGDSGRPKIAPVQGRVTYQGQPVARAEVSFRSDDSPRFSSGMTDAEGNYTLTTYEQDDGAVVGRNVITVSMQIMPPEDNVPDSPLTGEYFSTLESSKRVAATDKRLPVRYANPETSGLEYEVVDRPNEHNLQLE